MDRDQGGGVVNRGLNRQIDCGALQNMPPVRIENVQNALDVRNTLKNYFLTAEGQVPWQYEYIVFERDILPTNRTEETVPSTFSQHLRMLISIL